MRVSVSDVQKFWNATPCQSTLSQQSDRRKYFEEITHRRLQGREWHVPRIANFEAFSGKDVLEIGCGVGTDGFEFAKNGARYFGVDLTPNSIQLAKERFDLFHVDGTFTVANAEAWLPFEDNSFDHIYSFGVLHHSPETQAIIDEMYRVLRPDGTFTVMLYNKSSINYYIEIMFLRKLFRWILYPNFMPKLVSKVTGFDEWKLRGHREILKARRSISKEEWVSMNTDGPHCPLSKVYNKREAAELFQKFRNIKQEVWEFNTDHWSFIGKFIPKRVVYLIGRLWGWHRIIYGTK
jgi:ubiquinone/menaquinone biosynthesis C-methylase UbiE